MSKRLRQIHLYALSAGLIAAGSLVYNLIVLGLLYPRISRFETISPGWETAGILFGVSILLIGLYHLLSLAAILAATIRSQERITRTAIIIVLGILSGLMLLADITMLQEIGKEYIQGWNSPGEWIILFSAHGLHLLYLAFSLLTLRTNLQVPSGDLETVSRDHVLFQLTHTTGFLCGTLGIVLVITAAALPVSAHLIHETMVVFSTLILAPYFLILLIWIIRKGWSGLDEMLRLDLFRAGFVSMLLILPLASLLFYLQQSGRNAAVWELLWLPSIMMFTLSTFSASALWGAQR